MRTLKKSSLAFMSLLFLFVLGPQYAAFAHTDLISSTPAIDAVLEELPSAITLEFNENILVLSGRETSSIQVISPNGKHLETGQLEVDGRNLSSSLIASEQSGIFTVTWRAVAQDGHPVKGEYVFSITAKNSATPTPEVSISAPIETVKENSAWVIEILLGGLVVLIGLTFLVLRWRRNSGD